MLPVCGLGKGRSGRAGDRLGGQFEAYGSVVPLERNNWKQVSLTLVVVVVVVAVVEAVEVGFGLVSGFVDIVAALGTDLGDNLKLTVQRFHFYYRMKLLGDRPKRHFAASALSEAPAEAEASAGYRSSCSCRIEVKTGAPVETQSHHSYIGLQKL